VAIPRYKAKCFLSLNFTDNSSASKWAGEWRCLSALGLADFFSCILTILPKDSIEILYNIIGKMKAGRSRNDPAGSDASSEASDNVVDLRLPRGSLCFNWRPVATDRPTKTLNPRF